MIKKVLSSLTALALGVAALFIVTQIVSMEETTVKASSKKGATVFYLVPHQDDELINFGVSILAHKWAGHDVHVALLTDGGASNAIHKINKKLDTPITRAEFSAARDKEFLRSSTILGIPESNIHMYDYRDGELTVQNVKDVVKKIQKTYPDARFKVYSYYDNHSDHANTGIALQEMYDSGEVEDVRFFLNNRQFDKDRYPGVGHERYRPEFYAFLQAGAQAYDIWNPDQGWYGIGYSSAARVINYMLDDPKSRYHLPGWEYKE